MDDWDFSSIDDDYWTDTGNETNTSTYEPVEDNFWSNTGNTDWVDNSYGDNYSNPAGSYGNWFPQETPSVGAASPAVDNFLSNPSYNFAPTSNPLGSSTSSFLQDLFTKRSSANNVGQLGAALLSGYQKKQKASSLNNIANTVAATSDPWASQRPFYQQQAQQAVTNPYDSPIVKAQIEQLQRAQNIKDAAAGRRGNSLMGSTAVLGEAAKIAQSYQQQMANQGGAQLTPNTTSLADLMSKATNAKTDGYISPLVNALSKDNQSVNLQNALSGGNDQSRLSALIKFLGAS